jgi:hypothetical protein
LLTRARDCRPNAEWDQVLPCAAEAIALARREEDLGRLAAAAAAATDSAVWLPQQWAEVPEDTIEDLRWAMSELPAGDSADRCRVMVALALMLYYDPSARAEVSALADEGVVMARRLGDPALLAWSALTAWKALWTPEHADARLDLAHEALRASQDAQDPDTETVALVLLTGNLLELGDREAYAETARATGRLAARRRNAYVRMALRWLELSLAALRDDEDATHGLADELYELRPRLNPAMEGLHVAGIFLVTHMWDDRIGELIEPMTAAIAASGTDMAKDVLLLALARTGDVETLRSELATTTDYPVHTWSSTTTWCSFAETAAVAGDVRLAEQMVGHLEPLAGGVAVSGISSVMGPVDGYLALALAGCGRKVEAAEMADRAAGQSDEWGFTAYTDWLAKHRERLGF